MNVRFEDVVKRFGSTTACDHVTLDVQAGEIHALLGENGAGKSTLMRILAGLYPPDEGSIEIDGIPTRLKSPRDAIERGIGLVHQHFTLVDTLTVAENIALASPDARSSDHRPVRALSVGQRQRVELDKVLARGARLLALDEPTAVLVPQEVDALFATLRSLQKTVVFISHKLDEVLRISDRITVLRDGRIVVTLPTREATPELLARHMVGREIRLRPERPSIPFGEPRLSAANISTDTVNGLSLEVRAGEILGIAGVSGNGQVALAEVLAGLTPPRAGTILLDGRDVTRTTSRGRKQAGLAYVPEERMRDACVLDFSIRDNAILRDDDRLATADVFTREIMEKFDIRAKNINAPIKTLSGGNIQKLVLARELTRDPRVLIAAQPTRGVDVGAAAAIHDLLLRKREDGLATLLISEDLDELRAMSDRIAVMYEGRIVGVVAPEAPAEQLGLLMSGQFSAL